MIKFITYTYFFQLKIDLLYKNMVLFIIEYERIKMKKFIIIFILLIISVILYARFIGTSNYKIIEHTIKIENLSESFNGFKIVQFSDFLLGSTKTIEDLENIVNDINNIDADIIVFTGDLINENYNISNEEIEQIKENLRNLDCTLYKYAVIGDNDLENYKEIMTDSNFIVLDNESNYIFYEDIRPIKITGKLCAKSPESLTGGFTFNFIASVLDIST